MLFDHVSALSYDTYESLVTKVAFVPLIHAPMDSFLVLFQFEVVVEYSLARLALEESVSVSTDMNIQASLIHEPASALLADKVPKMAIHVQLQRLEIVEFHVTNRASRFLSIKFKRYHVVFDVRVYFLGMIFSQMLHNLIEVVDVALTELTLQTGYINTQDQFRYTTPRKFFSIFVVLQCMHFQSCSVFVTARTKTTLEPYAL